MPKHGSNGRDAMTRSKGTGHGGADKLQKGSEGHQVPGFLGREGVTRAQAREYTKGAADRTGASGKGTKITLP